MQPLVLVGLKAVWYFLKKLNIKLPHYLVITLLSIYPKEFKTCIQANICTLMFIAALLIVAKRWK